MSSSNYLCLRASQIKSKIMSFRPKQGQQLINKDLIKHQLAQLFLITLNLKNNFQISWLKLSQCVARTHGPASRANPRAVRKRMRPVCRCPKQRLCNLRRHLQHLSPQRRAARANQSKISTSLLDKKIKIQQSPGANFPHPSR